MNFSLEIPIIIEEDRCADCKHRFECWSSIARKVQSYAFTSSMYQNNLTFSASFNLSDFLPEQYFGKFTKKYCFSYNKLCEEIYKPDYVKTKYKGITYVTKAEISCYMDMKTLKDVINLEVNGYIV